MKVDFITETEPKLSAAYLKIFFAKYLEIMLKFLMEVKFHMEVLLTKKHEFPLKLDEFSDEDSDKDSQ